jgi:NTP pyrophosphatase (non-canonical NTP hydrolase)
MRSIATFEEYQAAVARTAIYPESGTGSVIALTYLGLGLGEAGEIQGKLKKLLRDQDGWVSPDRREALLLEAGDLLWYVTRLAEELGASLQLVAGLNIGKLASRDERGTLRGSGDHR